jgi:hypothetical protein
MGLKADDVKEKAGNFTLKRAKREAPVKDLRPICDPGTGELTWWGALLKCGCSFHVN